VVVAGHVSNGASRWIKLGLFSMQPTDVARLAVVVFVASWLKRHPPGELGFWKGTGPALLVVGGFAGLILLQPNLSSAALLGLCLWRCLRAFARASDPFAGLLAAGLTIQIGLYAIANLAVATGLAPTTGLPLPFVSYGGSALLANLAAAGLLYRVSAGND